MQIMEFELTEENGKEVTMPMDITLPKVFWLVLAQLAKETNQEIEKVFQRIFEIGLEAGPIVTMGLFKR
jgi:hypothetical protein